MPYESELNSVEKHVFYGKWITDPEFSGLAPRNVFHRQLEKVYLPCDEHRNRHILFRKRFSCARAAGAQIYISADDYYKLYINGSFVAQGPAPAYHFRYNYNEIDVTEFLREGENVIAVHTLYQGLINRVWQSGDNRHGLIMDLVIDGETVVSSDGSFLTAPHTGYTETGVCGYQTQFLERYDSCAPEVGFEQPGFDDSRWRHAEENRFDDHVLIPQQSGMLEFEKIMPVSVEDVDGCRLYDFGSTYVGYLYAAVKAGGGTATVRCAQELDDCGRARFELRANCRYEEEWILREGESRLDWFDYKAFRYAEIALPEGAEITEIYLVARHYPFELRTSLKSEYAGIDELRRIWELCVHTQKYGVQEVIQDCMEREKGFYLGDGCYTALTNMVLTGDDSMVRKLIDDAFATCFISDTLVTCMDCSFMQEIAEYPLILVYLVMWHYNITGDGGYLAENYPKVRALLDAYRREYEKNGLLRELDKWCVVEWPKNFQHGYAVDIAEGKVCVEAHVSINAYYIAAIRTANSIASVLGLDAYRDEAELLAAFRAAFYDGERKLFRDGEFSDHVSLVGNAFVYGFGLCPDDECRRNIVEMADRLGVDSLSFFCTFPLMMGYVRDGDSERIKAALMNGGAWLRMLREGATTTYEGWGRATKWNTSLFHLTMSYGALFMADADISKILSGV